MHSAPKLELFKCHQERPHTWPHVLGHCQRHKSIRNSVTFSLRVEGVNEAEMGLIFKPGAYTQEKYANIPNFEKFQNLKPCLSQRFWVKGTQPAVTGGLGR